MRVAIIGGGSGFAGALVDHLHREGHDIFWISPKKTTASISFDIKFTHFPFRANDPGVQYILESISAEVIVYLGAFDDTLDFSEGKNGGEQMMSELASLLALADRFTVSRFAFLSSEEALGVGGIGMLDEEHVSAPATAKGKYLAGAEQMLLVFGKSVSYQVVVARVSSVFGPQVSTPGKPDFVLEMLQDAQWKQQVHAPSGILRRPTYIADVTRGVELVLSSPDIESGIYQIAGDQAITDAEIARHLFAKSPEVTIDSSGGQAEWQLSHRKLTELTGFAPMHTVEEGLGRTVAWSKRALPKHEPVEQAEQDDAKKTRRGPRNIFRTLVSVFAPYLESLLLLLVFSVAAFLLRNDPQFKSLDFLLLYVIMVGAMYGKLNAALATLLGSVVHIWLQLEGQSFFAVLLRYGEFVHAAVMFTIGMVDGHVRDQLKMLTTQHEEDRQRMTNEYDELMVINQANASIKNALEQRLLGYGDSFAKIISIISDLDMMEPQRVIHAAVDVVRRIMRTEDVAIYQVGENSRYARLAAASSQAARVLGKSVRISDLPLMHEALMKNQVFINRELLPEYPLMAAPVMVGSRMVDVIMLWGMEFERLSPYSVNLLTVISRLISSSADRASRYIQAIRAEQFIPGTDVLNPAALEEALRVQRHGKENGVQDYTLLSVAAPAAGSHAFIEQANRVSDQVRDSDAVGYREDGFFIVLLRSTALDEAQFVVNRFQRAGIGVQVIEDSL